ncbi:MAG TPA: beta-galactosidase, partial [Chitinophaga sp.]
QLKDPVKLPGSMQAQGYGDNPSVRIQWIGEKSELFLQQDKYAPYRTDENYKFPFWLTPVKYYTGPAWYQREVNIPANWKDKHITLTLERCHWSTTVFVDDHPAGADSSLATPHVYDLSALLTPGRHTLSIRVDNRYIVDVGVNAHSVGDQTQGTWNGIAGNIALEAGDPVFIKHVQVFPDVTAKTATVKIWLGHITSQAPTGKLTLRAQLTGKGNALPPLTQSFSAQDSMLTLQYPMGNDPQLWDEFHHQLYQLSVQLHTADNKYRDERTVRFGMRDIRAREDKIFVNGRPIFLRGTLECAIFPLTGYPPTDTASWGRIFRILQAHGLNHMRFHSWCPPEAAFIAADNAGIYLSVEVDAWARVGDGTPVDRYLYEESNRIVAAYGNHPSFCLLVPSNEPHGDKKRDAYLAAFVQYWQQKDSRRLYSAGSGWPLIAQNDYHITPDPRIQGWGEELKSVINAQPPNTLFDFKEKMKKLPAPGKPVVAHEIGQWCVYPDFTEIKKYTGLLQARNFEIFRDFMKKEQLLPQAHDFLMAS